MKRIELYLIFLVLLCSCSMTNRAWIKDPVIIVKPIKINSDLKEYHAYTWITGGRLEECKFHSNECNKKKYNTHIIFNYLILLNPEEGKVFPITILNEYYKPNRKFAGKDNIDIVSLLKFGETLMVVPRGEMKEDFDFINYIINSAFQYRKYQN